MNSIPAKEIQIPVLGTPFQAFIDPDAGEPVFSQSGAARGLDIPETSARRFLRSQEFKSLRGKAFKPSILLTTANPNPIGVVTQTDLVFLVQIAAEKGYPVAIAMQEASFAVLLQQSVDEALNIERPRSEYLEAGASLRQRLEYQHSYRVLKESTFEGGHGVTGLCKINRQVSSLAVPDADQRRAEDRKWRSKCNSMETVKITVGNTVHDKAVKASPNTVTLDRNLGIAADRTQKIYELLDEPFY